MFATLGFHYPRTNRQEQGRIVGVVDIVLDVELAELIMEPLVYLREDLIRRLTPILYGIPKIIIKHMK